MKPSFLPKFGKTPWAAFRVGRFLAWTVGRICLAATLCSSLPLAAQVNGVFREVYANIGAGVAVSDLTNHPTFPNNPTSTNFITDFFDAPHDILEAYGQRLRALILPPTTGNYIFWIASDDNGVLYLSTNDSPNNKVAIATVNSWTNWREWTREANQQSAPIPLVQGQRYYIEALMKEGGGGDNLTVRWQLPGGAIEEPVPASRLIAFTGAATTPPIITTQPVNLTAVEGGPASFSVVVSNFDLVSYQWQRNSNNIAGATSATYTISSVSLADGGAYFRCVITNALGTNASSNGRLLVDPDGTRPTLVSVLNIGATTLSVVFSEPVEAATALNRFNYSLNNGASVSAAAAGSDTRTVLLTSSTLAFQTSYTLSVSAVRDRAAVPNTILAASTHVFLASDFTPRDIGSPAPPGLCSPVVGGTDITGGGGDIGGSADSFQFGYQQRTGNFDVKARIASFSNTSPWAEAGLMARETLDTSARFAAVLAAPSIAGISFLSRDPAGAGAAAGGQFPVNYPNTWLRLSRAGNVFTGFASYEGATWTQLGAATLALPATVYFGMAVSSHDPAQSATAQFRELQSSVGGVLGTTPTTFEPLGPSSRRTGLTFSEIMYHPGPRADGKELEFVELFNSNPFFEDLGGYRLSGAIDYTFANGTTLPAGGFLVIARVPGDVMSAYGIGGVLGPYTNNLPNDNGTVRLRNQQDAVLLEVNYETKSPWPIAPDGTGHSLVLARPSYGEDNVLAWEQSDQVGGSPGGIDPVGGDPLRTVVINEFLAHTDPPDEDFIELVNYSNQAVNLAGCFLSDDATTNKFMLPASATIAARGFLSFTATQLGFNLGASGESIFLVHSNRARVLDAVRFNAQQNAVSMGRFPNGAPDFYRLSTKTPGASNTAPRLAEVVLNEILYSPISGVSDDEFVEVNNRTGTNVNISGWRVTGGISFPFPDGTILGAGGYAVVARNAARLLANNPGLNPALVFGDFSGSLAGSGERLALTKPDEIVSTNGGFTITNRIHIAVDEVAYRKGGRWGRWADGGGSSLELIDWNSDHRRPSSWADSTETAKAAWSTIEWTGVMDNGNGACDSIQLFLQGAGECLVDNVEVIPSGAGNSIANANFNTSATGWVFQGTHDATTWQATGGFGDNGGCLRVRASGRGDTGANRIRTPLAAALAGGTTVTLRAKVRWLVGYPEILLRLKGNYLEAAGRLSTPANAGTPGARNSRFVANAGPAIWNVAHTPVLPAASQAVIVTARAYDPNGLPSLQLKYRVDPSATLTTLSMLDNGAGGDAVAGDGVYSATIPGQVSGALIAFHLQATDGFVPSATTKFPDNAQTRECLIKWGETHPQGTFGTYRIWMTQATANDWTTRPKNSNEPLDVTFAYGNFRAIYNARSLYSGSPWHTPGYNGPTANLCDYVLIAPEDDLLLGTEDFVLASVGNLGNDGSAQAEQAAFWIARKLDLPYNYRRYINLFVNGVKRGAIFEDSQQPSSQLVEEWFPNDADGYLHKIEDWFEFDDSGDGKLFNVDATLQNFTTTGGVKKAARYRWCWRPRAVKDSANNFTPLFNLVDALNATAPEPYTSQAFGQVDIEEWMRIFAVEHIVGNWDAYGYNRGKNMYVYKPIDGKWTLFMWDIDFVLGSGSDGPTTGLFGSNDPTVTRLWSHPPFVRAYWRAFQDAVDGPLLGSNMNPMLDAKYAAFQANGVGAAAPSGIKTYVSQRRAYLQTQLSGVASAFAITSNAGGNFATNNNLLQLSGTAPVGVKTIRVNGVDFPATWTGVNSWVLKIPLNAGGNALTVVGYDLRGNPIAGANDTITVTFNGGAVSPVDNVIINEIMYNPLAAGASFIEIYNLHPTFAFDLSDWRLNGADFTFPEGTYIAANGFLVIAKDRDGFVNAYGTQIPIIGEMEGDIDNGGENLQLIKPGPTPAQDLVVDEVRYDDDAPWPAAANGTGPSLQLIDPTKDNRRVANWAASGGGGATPAVNLVPITQSWKFEQTSNLDGVNWSAPGFVDSAWPAGSALLYVENAPLPAPKNTALTVGRTTYYFRTHFTFSGNPNGVRLQIQSVIDDGAIFYLNGTEIYRLGTDLGAVGYGTFANRTIGDAGYEGPFDIPAGSLASGDNVLAVEVHQANTTSSDVVFGLTLDIPASATSTAYTPGAANSVLASVPVFPNLWINEVQPNNSSGIQDRFGDRDPWLELHNPSGGSMSLANYYLTDTSANLTKWPFPAGVSMNSGQFTTVWADGEAGESIVTELHTSFRLNVNTGFVALVQLTNGVPRIVDYLDYKLVPVNKSFGSFPDAQPIHRQLFAIPTPAGANNSGFPPVQVFINEWMAANTLTLIDPADGKFDDWFELFNAGSTTVDLTGYYLTDNLALKTQFTIPAGKTIPSGGFLLVWADNDTGQNSDGPDIHTNFKLNGDGEAIGLYDPNGNPIDEVSFLLQTNDVSMGRCPDGFAPPFAFVPTATPRGSNICPGTGNTPPTLDPIGNKDANEGVLLTLTAAGHDTETPTQALTYTLAAGAPSGAAIGLSSGVFTWIPDENQGPGLYGITVRVTDNGLPALSTTRTFSVTVHEVNTPPALTAIAPQIVSEGATLAFTALASDNDFPANTLTFTLDPGAPGGASITTAGAFSWIPNEAQGPGVYSITVRVTDDSDPALSDFRSFNVTVNEANNAPVLTAIGSKTVNEGDVLAFDATATDSDMPPQSLTYSLLAGAPPGSAISPAGAFTWLPTEGQGPGSYSVGVRVRDNGSPQLSDTKGFTISVNESNTAPVLAALSNTNINEGATLTFTNSVTDSDLPSQALTFSLDPGAPSGASVNSTNGVFSWAPTEAQCPGAYAITVRVTDNGAPPLSDSKTFTVGVNEVNTAPVLDPIGNKTVNEGTSLAFTAKATDTDFPANTLTFSLDAGAPSGASITPAGAFTWASTEDQGPNSYTITVRVTDGGSPLLSDFETIMITVNEVNMAPTLDPIGNKTVNEGSSLAFTAKATDTDFPANGLTFSLDAGAPSGASITPAGAFTWATTEADGPGSYPVTVRVTDNGSSLLSDFKAITITVNEVNMAPTLDPIGNKTVNEGTSLAFTAKATDTDFPANALTFSLDAGAPPEASIHSVTGLFTWTAPAGASATNSFTVRVTDSSSSPLSAFETFTIVSTLTRISVTIVLTTDGAVVLSWGTIPGKTYRLSYCENLVSGVWVPLGADKKAPGTLEIRTDEIGNNRQRFYRVEQLD